MDRISNCGSSRQWHFLLLVVLRQESCIAPRKDGPPCFGRHTHMPTMFLVVPGNQAAMDTDRHNSSVMLLATTSAAAIHWTSTCARKAALQSSGKLPWTLKTTSPLLHAIMRRADKNQPRQRSRCLFSFSSSSKNISIKKLRCFQQRTQLVICTHTHNKQT